MLIVMAYTCTKDKLFKDDELSIQKMPFAGNQLRTDGYYYQLKDQTFFTIYCFYRNGIILYLGGGYSSSQLIELESRIQNGSYYNDAKKYKYFWGIFNIENNNIKFERWYASSGGPLPTYVREGNIVNDTTFNITEIYRIKKGKKTEVANENETYHFKAFSPKPDSTNTFIK